MTSEKIDHLVCHWEYFWNLKKDFFFFLAYNVCSFILNTLYNLRFHFKILNATTSTALVSGMQVDTKILLTWRLSGCKCNLYLISKNCIMFHEAFQISFLSNTKKRLPITTVQFWRLTVWKSLVQTKVKMVSAFWQDFVKWFLHFWKHALLHAVLYPTATYFVKLSKIRSYKSARHNFFSTRIVNLWNSLPKHVVEVDTVIHFEKQLDKFWQNVEFKFDYRAIPPDRLQPAGIVSQPGSGHRGLYWPASRRNLQVIFK